MANNVTNNWRVCLKAMPKDGKDATHKSGCFRADVEACLKTFGSASCLKRRLPSGLPCHGCSKS
jgi:hypothetical protein